MTLREIVGSLCYFASVCVVAAESQPPTRTLEAQRAQIVADRASLESAFEVRQLDCYQRFAVNDCMLKVKRERRLVMDGLRKQEIALNDLERQASAKAELDRIQANVGPERQAEIQLQEEQALKAAEERRARADQKQITTTPAGPAAVPVKPAEAVSALGVQQNEKAFADKLMEAKQRRTDKATSLASQGPITVKTLPLPR